METLPARELVCTGVFGVNELATIVRTKKVMHKDARYTKLGTKSEHCGNCDHYEAGPSCEVVVGPIVPDGWCKVWKES